MTIPLGPIDIAVLVVYFGAAVAIGLFAAGRIRTLDAYPWATATCPGGSF